MKTSHAFINEMNSYDSMFESLENFGKEIAVATYAYESAIRQIDLKSFFEAADKPEEKKDEAKESFLGKIGNAVITLIEKIKNFMKTIKEKIFGNGEDLRKDTEVVNDILAKNPQLKKQVAEGIKKEWFTYRDVAAYEKDVAGLINMLDQKAIDNATFLDRMSKAADKFNKSAAPIISVGCTIAGLVTLVPKMLKGCKETTDFLGSMNGQLEKIKEETESNRADKAQDRITAKVNAIRTVISGATEECQKRSKAQEFAHGIFRAFKQSAAGKALKLDDKSVKDYADEVYLDGGSVKKQKEQLADQKAKQEEEEAKKARQKKIDDELADKEYRKKKEADSYDAAADTAERHAKIDRDADDEVYKREVRKAKGLTGGNSDGNGGSKKKSTKKKVKPN
jgi:hypothetical protein